MKYMGSKNRHAKELLSIILHHRKPTQWYIEPFVGGFNMIDKVVGNRIASDTHYYLIELFKAIQNGWIPPTEVSEAEYQHIKEHKESTPAYLVGFVGFGCSYAGKWFGGYARGNANNGQPRNYCNESKKNILKQAENIQDVIIHHKHYKDLHIPPNSIVYCDPPYEGTTQYKDAFEYDVFWSWVRNMTKQGHDVFVSEYNAPHDFVCLWTKEVNNTLVKKTGSKQGIEKLFRLRS